MKLLTLSISALTLLQSAIAFAKVKPADSTNSSAREILAWLETLRFPSLQDCPYVKVTITQTNPQAGEEPGFVRVDGFLLKDSGNAFTIFVIALQENLATYYPMSDPPFWPLTVATFEKESSKAKERAAYKILGFEAEASALKKEFSLPNEDKINTDLWHEGFGRHLSKPAAIAVFASACRQNHIEKLAAELVNGISRTYERYLSESEKEKPFQKFLEDAISESLLWHATLQFGDLTIPRKQLLTTFRDLKERFPHSRHQSAIQETIKLLEPMVREDEEHRTKPLAELTEDEKVRELIFQLRDQNGAQEMQPGWSNIFARDDSKNPPSPAARLVKIGYAAVPQLIDALDDSRFTRSVGFHRGFYYSHYILRVGDCAQVILNRIADRSFYEPESTTGTMFNDKKIEETKRQAQAWWSDFQKKGEKRSLIDAVRAGDENSVSQAEKLLDKYRDVAADAIMAGAQATKSESTRAALVELVGKIEDDATIAFLHREIATGPALKSRLTAARSLFERGDAGGVPAMIDEWNQAVAEIRSGKPHKFNQENVSELAQFLAESGRVDAIKALRDSLPDIAAGIRMAIAGGFAPLEIKLGAGFYGVGKSAASEGKKSPTAEPDFDNSAQALLVSLLDDDGFLPISGGVGEKELSYSMPRLRDYAGFVLAKRWPQKYHFHWSLYWTENDPQISELKNAWKKGQGLAVETTAPLKQRELPERNAKGSPTRILEVRTDSNVDSRTQQRLQSLRGNSLTPQKLIAELKFLTEHLPKDAHGLRFSAERTGTDQGFVIDVHWLSGPRRSDESILNDDVIAGKEDIQIESFTTDEYQRLSKNYAQALRSDATTPIAVHFIAAPD